MLSQIEIIGEHPEAPNIFGKWFDSTDKDRVPLRCQRSLSGKLPSNDPQLINWLAKKIIEHHYAPSKLERLKSKYKKIGFPKYADQHRQIPTLENTKKGNATEIVLIEYIENCQLDREFIKYFKFRYNPNVDQSMKGDDALLIDVIDSSDVSKDVRVFLGEAKFRSAPDKAVLRDISNSLGKDKLPLSYTFLIDRLYEDSDTEDIAELLEEFIMEEVKAKGNIRYAGLLLSNNNTSAYVEKNFTCDNPRMLIISAEIEDPQLLIDEVFNKVDSLLSEPDLI